MDPWLQAAQLVGVPASILAALGVGLVRACYWLAPRVDRVVIAHLEFLEKTTSFQAEIKTVVSTLRDHSAEQAARQSNRLDAVDQNLARIDSRLEALRETCSD